MSTSLVLRLPRTDVANDYVLVNLQQSGSSPLDLKLSATDGNDPFVGHVQQNSLDSLQSSTSHLPSQDWTSIVSFVLLQSPHQSPVVTGVEALAHIPDGSSQLVISIRKKISGITQRLGTITLEKNYDEDIQLFEWTGFAVSRADSLAGQVVTLQTSLTDHQNTIAQLTSQLDDLVKAKKTHQEELLKKFACLLNSKKLKIRDQQRLLAHAKVDPKTAKHVESTRSATGRKPGPSRANKRKSNPEDHEVDTDDDDGGETDVSEHVGEADKHQQVRETSDRETTDDESDASGFDPMPTPSQAPRSNVGARGRALESIKSKQSPPAPKEPVTLQPPPRRELPFGKKNSQPISQPTPKPEPVEEDDDTEDEL